MKPFRNLTTALGLMVIALPLVACHEEGPAEKAGKSLDKTGEKIQNTIDPPGPAQKAGQAVDDATK